MCNLSGLFVGFFDRKFDDFTFFACCRRKNIILRRTITHEKDVDNEQKIKLLCKGFGNVALAKCSEGARIKIMTNTAAKTSFSISNPDAKASYGMVRKIASQFSNAPKCPKDIKWGTIHGHFLQKLNAKKPLTQGQDAKILSMKALPSADIKAMRSYKKLVSLG